MKAFTYFLTFCGFLYDMQKGKEVIVFLFAGYLILAGQTKKKGLSLYQTVPMKISIYYFSTS